MKPTLSGSRRSFIKESALAGATLLASPHAIRAANKKNNALQVGVMGLSRGVAHVRRFAETPNVSVTYVCDVDESRLQRGARALGKVKAQGVGDFRRMLEDKELDAVSIAAPNFWHTPAAVLAMQAGKHVYVEKPISLSYDHARRVTELAESLSLVLMVGHLMEYHPALRLLKQLVDAGELG